MNAVSRERSGGEMLIKPKRNRERFGPRLGKTTMLQSWVCCEERQRRCRGHVRGLIEISGHGSDLPNWSLLVPSLFKISLFRFSSLEFSLPKFQDGLSA